MAADWAYEEFKGIQFNDARLCRRFMDLMRRFGSHLGYSLTQAAGSGAKAKGAYRFFANEKVEMAVIVKPHVKMLIERAKNAGGPILNIQDTSGLNYFKHPSKEDQGHLGSSKKRPDSTGYWLHTGMATTSEGVPLGITYQEVWARQNNKAGETADQKKSRLRKQPLDEKESMRWLDGAEATLPLISANLDVIQVGDRESDIFEFMQKCREIGSSFLVRSKSDRSVEVLTPSGRSAIKSLHSHVNAAPILANGKVVITGNGDRKGQTVTISIRRQKVTILVPRSNRKKENADGLIPIEASVILVTSRVLVNGQRLYWILLTDRKTETEADLKLIINWYKLRWQIEIFHKTIKSGCKIEDCRLSNLDKLAPYLLMKSIAAVKIMELTYASQHSPNAPAKTFFSEQEWNVLKVILYHEDKRPRVPKIQEIIQRIAIYGGYLPRKNKNPGIITLWRGWDSFQAGMDLLKRLPGNPFKTCGW